MDTQEQAVSRKFYSNLLYYGGLIFGIAAALVASYYLSPPLLWSKFPAGFAVVMEMLGYGLSVAIVIGALSQIAVARRAERAIARYASGLSPDGWYFDSIVACYHTLPVAPAVEDLDRACETTVDRQAAWLDVQWVLLYWLPLLLLPVLGVLAGIDRMPRDARVHLDFFEVFRPMVIGVVEAIVLAVMILTVRLRWEKVFIAWQQTLRISIVHVDPSQIPPCPIEQSKPAAIRSLSAGGAIPAPPVFSPPVEEEDIEVPSIEEQSASSLFDQVDPPPVEGSLGMGSRSSGSFDYEGSVSLEGSTAPWEDPGDEEDEDESDLFPDDYALQPVEDLPPVESPPDFSAMPQIEEPPAPSLDDLFAPPVEETPEIFEGVSDSPTTDVDSQYPLEPSPQADDSAPVFDDFAIKPPESDIPEITIAPPLEDEPEPPIDDIAIKPPESESPEITLAPPIEDEPESPVDDIPIKPLEIATPEFTLAPPVEKGLEPPVDDIPIKPLEIATPEVTLAPTVKDQPEPTVDDIAIKPPDNETPDVSTTPLGKDNPDAPAITLVNSSSLDIAVPNRRPSLDPRDDHPDARPAKSVQQPESSESAADLPLELAPEPAEPPADDLLPDDSPDEQLLIPDGLDFSQPSFSLESLDSQSSDEPRTESSEDSNGEEDDPLDELFK